MLVRWDGCNLLLQQYEFAIPCGSLVASSSKAGQPVTQYEWVPGGSPVDLLDSGVRSLTSLPVIQHCLDGEIA